MSRRNADVVDPVVASHNGWRGRGNVERTRRATKQQHTLDERRRTTNDSVRRTNLVMFFQEDASSHHTLHFLCFLPEQPTLHASIPSQLCVQHLELTFPDSKPCILLFSAKKSGSKRVRDMYLGHFAILCSVWGLEAAMELSVVDLEPYLRWRAAQGDDCELPIGHGVGNGVLNGGEAHSDEELQLGDGLRLSCEQVAACLRETGALVVRDPRCSTEDNDRFLDMMERYFGQASTLKRKQERPHLHYQVRVTNFSQLIMCQCINQNSGSQQCPYTQGGVDGNCQLIDWQNVWCSTYWSTCRVIWSLSLYV